MIGQYTRIFLVVTMVTLTMTHVSKASCKVGDTVIEVGKSYKSPPPDCKKYYCRKDNTTSSRSICSLIAVHDDCCKYGYDTYTKLVFGCKCTYPKCKDPSWSEYLNCFLPGSTCKSC